MRNKLNYRNIQNILNKICMRKFKKHLSIKVIIDRNNNPWYKNDEYVAMIWYGELHINRLYLQDFPVNLYDTLIHEIAHELCGYLYYDIDKGLGYHHKLWQNEYIKLGGSQEYVNRVLENQKEG